MGEHLPGYVHFGKGEVMGKCKLLWLKSEVVSTMWREHSGWRDFVSLLSEPFPQACKVTLEGVIADTLELQVEGGGICPRLCLLYL